MKKYFGIFAGMLVVVMAIAAIPVAAHDGHTHEATPASAVSTVKTAELEQMVSLLKQLVVLLTELKARGVDITKTSAVPQVTQHTQPTVHADEPVESNDTEHHHDDVEKTATTTVVEKKLVVEVEEHSGKTHVHVRYVDKPESMFFVDVPLTKTDALVTTISAQTGLDADAVRAALTYLD